MITTLTAPACRAVSLEEARQQLRLDGDDEDLLLTAKLDAAQAELELLTGLRLCPQTLSLELEAWEDEVVVPVRPCSVTQIQYVGLSGAVVTMAASDYVVRRRHGLTRIRPTTGKVWPTLADDGLITITLTAGFAETDPDFLIARAAILVKATSEFQNREGGACLAFDTLASQLAAPMDLASKLDTRVRIERKTVTLDPAYGTQEASWSVFANVWGEVRDVLPSRAERLAEKITIANRPARVRVRYLPGLAADMRLIIGGRIMQIISGPAMLGRREAMELIVEDHSTEGDAP